MAFNWKCCLFLPTKHSLLYGISIDMISFRSLSRARSSLLLKSVLYATGPKYTANNIPKRCASSTPLAATNSPSIYTDWLNQRFYNSKDGAEFLPKWLWPASLSNTMTLWHVNTQLTANEIYDLIDDILEDTFPGVNRTHYIAYEWKSPHGLRYLALVFSSREIMLAAQDVFSSPQVRKRIGDISAFNVRLSSHAVRYSRIVAPDAVPLLDLTFLAVASRTSFVAPPADMVRLCSAFGEVYAMQAVRISPQNAPSGIPPLSQTQFIILVALTRAVADGDTMVRVLDNAVFNGQAIRVVKLGSEPCDLRAEETQRKVLMTLHNATKGAG